MSEFPTPIDPEQPTDQNAASPQQNAAPDPNAPLSFVPHEPPSQQPYRVKLNRYGEMEEHELIRLLDSIQDERARARFRESVYISVLVCCTLAWVLLYGPRYLWHAPQLINPADAIRKQEIIALNAPILHPAPVLRPTARPLDSNTLKQLREMTREDAKPVPAAPSSTPPMPNTASSLPNAPQPSVVPTPEPTAPRVPNAPMPEAPSSAHNSQPNFSTPSDSLNEAIRQSAQNRNQGGPGAGMVPTGKGSTVGGGVQILSDTQGVDFSDYVRHLLASTYRAWIPLLPEETDPPLSKQGETYIVFTILPDGTLAKPPAMKLEASSHDTAIDRAAWGSLISQGQLPPLPSKFHGPGLTLRLHFTVNKNIGQ